MAFVNWSTQFLHVLKSFCVPWSDLCININTFTAYKLGGVRTVFPEVRVTISWLFIRSIVIESNYYDG